MMRSIILTAYLEVHLKKSSQARTCSGWMERGERAGERWRRAAASSFRGLSDGLSLLSELGHGLLHGLFPLDAGEDLRLQGAHVGVLLLLGGRRRGPPGGGIGVSAAAHGGAEPSSDQPVQERPAAFGIWNEQPSPSSFLLI